MPGITGRTGWDRSRAVQGLAAGPRPCPCPPGRAGRTACATWPTSSWLAPPSRAGPLPIAAAIYREAVLRPTPACSACLGSPAPTSHPTQHLTDLSHGNSRNAVPRTPKSIEGTGYRKRSRPPARHARWSHHWQPGGPIVVAENPSGYSHDRGRRQTTLPWIRPPSRRVAHLVRIEHAIGLVVLA
jgi:hypothetical protein